MRKKKRKEFNAMWEITHLPHQGNKNVAQSVAVQNYKDFLALLLKLTIVALGHRVDLYSRLESNLFHTKMQKDILLLFFFF